MTQSLTPIALPPPFPDHTQLPESDGRFVKNFQERPQSLILTDSIGPVLQRLHPDGQNSSYSQSSPLILRFRISVISSAVCS